MLRIAAVSVTCVLTLAFNLSFAGEPAAPETPKPADPNAPAPADAPKPPEPPATVVNDETQPTIVVTASRLPTPVNQTGVSISTVDGRENREVHQNVDLAEALRQTVGVLPSRSGLAGDLTSVFIRGGNSNHNLFLYDGWKVNRQGGGFDLSRVDPVGAGRIEIARGPSSSLFGTDAVTGTINVLTEKGEGAPELTTSAAGGTYGTDRETLQLKGSHKKFSYNVSASRLHRDEATSNNSELEAYSYSARLDFEFNADHRIKFIARGSDFHKGFYEDSGSGFGTAVESPDPNDQIYMDDQLFGLEYKGRICEIWDTTLRLGHYNFEYNLVSQLPNPDSTVFGFAQTPGKTDAEERRPSLDWQNDIRAFETEDGSIKYVVTVGTSVEEESFDQNDTQFGTNLDRSETNWSVFMQNRLELYNRAFITAGIRREENGQFGHFFTARGDASILIPESDTRIHGSVGNAFRAPSFFELYSSFGNPDLEPEENVAFDVGLEQHFWKKRIRLGATYFNNDFDQLVDFDFDTSLFANLKTAETNGFELEAEFNPIKQLTVRANATFLHTEDPTGRRLLRRPANTYTAQIIGRPIEGLEISLDLLRVGERGDFGPAGRTGNEHFTRVDAAISYRFLKYFRAFGRIENVLDESYEEVLTFPSSGSTILAGLEFQFKF